MNKKHLYFLAVIGLIIIRVLVLNTNFAGWLQSMGLVEEATKIMALRSHPNFLHFIGGWVLPVFVFAVIVYWLTEEDEDRIPKQFFLLPLVFLAFSLIADTLASSLFTMNMLYEYPLVILPYGYGYVVVWALLIWLLRKAGFAK